MGQRRRRCTSALALILLCLAAGLGAQEPGQKTTQGAVTRSLLNEGRAFLQSNDLDRARSCFENAVAGDPTSAQAHYLLGVVAERRKDLSAAAASFSAAIRYAPTMATAHDRLGFVLGQSGRTEEALREFERAVQLEPSLFDAQYHLGATRWWT